MPILCRKPGNDGYTRLAPTYGRPTHPEDTVEQRWYSDATAGAFHDILLTTGLALTALRKARGLTQADLADAAGVSRQTIVSVEKGHFDPSLPLAFRLASIFGCQIEDIFTPDGL